MIEAEFRPIETWPAERTVPGKRLSTSRFKSTYNATLNLLERELRHLDGKRIVIETAHKASDIRLDGWPRANAVDPQFPGVIVSFESKHGPLRYYTDVFDRDWSGDLPGWQGNLRAIALGLEALRKIDRYGIALRNEQYTGWSALPPGTIVASAAPMTFEEAMAWLRDAAGFKTLTQGDVETAYKVAAKRLHPDKGGDTAKFQKLEDVMRVLRSFG